MAALCRYSRFSVVLNHALRHSRNISLINNVDEKIYKNCITPISDRSWSPYSPTSLQRLYSTGSSSSEVGKNAELRTEASKNEQKTEAQLEKGTEASENILTPEAQLEESIEISENAQKTKAQLEESTEASETVQKPAVLIEESIKASETVQKPAALFEESIKASETVQKPAALFEESIKASENGQKTHDKVQEIETSKVRNVSAFANQNVGYTLFMEDNFLDTRNKNLPNLKINNVEYPSDFPASEYWRRYRFDEECEWTAVEREIQKCDKMGKFLSLRFFNLVMRCALFKDDFTEDQATRLLLTTGFSAARIPPAELSKWTEFLDNKFMQLGHSYSIRYYNALLKVMLEHKTDFSVVDFLARLEKAGVAPNRVTLGRCLMKYCRSGNMDAANEILEHMKATETLITKKVYLSIMSGHFAAGNYDTAMALFKDMERVGFGLEQTAFHEAIIGNMLADNREGVVKLFEDAKEADFELSEQALCQLIESAAVYDRPEYCELFLEKLKGTSNHYYNRGLETLIPLLRRGYYKIAYDFFMGLENPSPFIIINAMMVSDMPRQEELRFLQQLRQDLNAHDVFESFIESCYGQHNFESAVGLLPHLQREGVKIKHMGFLPILMYFRNLDNFKGMRKEVLPYLPKDSDMIRVVKSVFPPTTDFIAVLQKNMGLSKGQMAAYRIVDAISKAGSDLTSVIAQAKQAEEIDEILPGLANVSKGYLQKTLFQYSMNNAGQWKDILELMAVLKEKGLHMQNKDFIQHLTANVSKQEMKDELLNKGLYLSWNSLKSLGLASVCTKEEGEKITSLDKIRFADMPLEELKKRMIHFLHMFSFRRELLIKSSRAKDFELFEKVLSYKTKNDPKDIYVEGVKSAYYLQQKNDHMEAYNCLKSVEEIHSSPGRTWYVMHLSNLSLELWKANLFEEAIDALTLRQKDFQNPNVKITLSLPSFLMNLEPTAENCQLVQRLVSTAREYNLKFTFEDMITFLASSGDKEQVLAGLQMYHTSKNVNVTCGRLLMIAFKPFLDNRKDLQNVYEKLSQKFNENLVLLGLAAVHLELDKFSKFEKIINTQGLHIDHKVMTPIFLKWREEDKVECIDKFIELSKGVPGNVQLAYDCSQLRYMCDEVKFSVEECVEFFKNTFQGEQSLPPLYDLKYFGTYLKMNNHPLPFDESLLKGNEMEYRQNVRKQRSMAQKVKDRLDRTSEEDPGDQVEGNIEFVDLLTTMKKPNNKEDKSTAFQS
ncbi:leucine-rich PPR motif-containing protein, mitochondrial-like [Mya arenaria]|uniref:leucine-rich PPR motif-containing protein, mitochondrial-like n=1 Tax=Mya arenaria TaxID=6604 RepID=UPI0022E6E8E8|nr:leucine-rich PPR motif-containing protein, mitochondrial-like [Mya arenaria]